MTTAGLLLAAGASRRLGRAKQLLPYPGGPTLLDASLSAARACRFDQLLVALGAGAREIRSRVDLAGADVIVNPAGAGEGCSSSIAAALPSVRVDCDVLVLLLGDQPAVAPQAVERLVRSMADCEAPMGVCAYDDGLGHPFAFARALFPDLARLHGDKAVWRLRDSLADEVVEVPAPGRVPLDVDTEHDYQVLFAAAGRSAG